MVKFSLVPIPTLATLLLFNAILDTCWRIENRPESIWLVSTQTEDRDSAPVTTFVPRLVVPKVKLIKVSKVYFTLSQLSYKVQRTNRYWLNWMKVQGNFWFYVSSLFDTKTRTALIYKVLKTQQVILDLWYQLSNQKYSRVTWSLLKNLFLVPTK